MNNDEVSSGSLEVTDETQLAMWMPRLSQAVSVDALDEVLVARQWKLKIDRAAKPLHVSKFQADFSELFTVTKGIEPGRCSDLLALMSSMGERFAHGGG